MAVALLVEDNPTNRKLMRDILEIRFEVVETPTAEEALTLVQTRKPDLMVLDLQLPGMDGLTLVRRLKEAPETREIPIVAVSADAMQANIDRALKAGCVSYVTKPIIEDPFALVDRLERLLTPGS
jgi:CheY-like chemotaxis protein